MTAEGFRVTAKGRAFENDVVAATFDRGASKAFESRRAAEAFAKRATRTDGVRVVVQAAAPQDDSCDAYLVAIPDRHTTEPANPDDDYWRFQTEANQQGAIGEVLATTPRTNPPAFTWFVRRDLDHPDDLTVRVHPDPDPVGGWWPDCRLVATVDGDPVAEYLCEVKTGDASFQRRQREGMDAYAESGRVLTARVRIDSLPDAYEVHVEAYEPDG